MTTEVAYSPPAPPPTRRLELVAPVEPETDDGLSALAGSALTPDWLARMVGADAAAIRRAVERGLLVALRPRGAREPLIPLWQLGGDGRPLLSLEGVLAEAERAGMSPLELHELMSRRTGLTGGERVADALRAGRADYVRSVIRAEAG